MDWNIPERYELGPRIVHTIEMTNSDVSEQNNGHYLEDYAEIYLNPHMFPNSTQQKIIWWHEAFHSITDALGIKIKHRYFTPIAAAIVQILNTMEGDFNE